MPLSSASSFGSGSSSTSSSQPSESTSRRHIVETVQRDPSIEPSNTPPNELLSIDDNEIASISSSPPPYDAVVSSQHDEYGYGTFYSHLPSPESASVGLSSNDYFPGASSPPTLVQYDDVYRDMGVDWSEVILTAAWAMMIVFTVWFIRAIVSGDLSFWS
ncbi:hypothetical protein F4861DRAFT_163853 [Xylaria intraflava]|nr:hypothetical protein F4861DRAFT_163853 [Xylaria intraflava]